jgi:hypothetical protein
MVQLAPRLADRARVKTGIMGSIPQGERPIPLERYAVAMKLQALEAHEGNPQIRDKHAGAAYR